MKRALVVAGRIQPTVIGGGGDHFAYNLLTALASEEHDYELYGWYGFKTKPFADWVPASTPREIEEARSRRRVRIRQTVPRIFQAGKSLYRVRDRARFRRSLHELGDKDLIIHANDSYVASLIGDHIPYVYTHHGKGSLVREIQESGEALPGYLQRWYRSVDLVAMSRCRNLVFPSESAMELAAAEYPEIASWDHVRIVYTGVAATTATPPSTCRDEESEEIEILTIAHHVREKGLDICLELFAQLHRRLADFGRRAKLRSIGRLTSFTSDLRRKAEQLGIGEDVVWDGLLGREEVAERLGRARLLLHTPRVVVFDLVLLEAMSRGLPIVASKVRGNVEALGDEYPLYISEYGESLAVERATRVLVDIEKWKSLSNRLRARFLSCFTQSRMALDYLRLYSEES